MTLQEDAVRARPEAGSTYLRRGRYFTPENGFTFTWPPVRARQFLSERDRAFAQATPTGEVVLDASGDLGMAYPATTPAMLVRYLKIRAGGELRTTLVASGELFYAMTGAGESRNGSDAIAWGAGDVFCFPGGAQTVHRAGGEDCLLVAVTDEPLLACARLRPPAPGRSMVEATHWPAAEIERQFQTVWQRPITDNTTGHSVQFGSAALAPSPNSLPFLNVAINSLAPGCDQRPHRHNGVAVTFALQGDGVYSMIDGERIDWSDGAAQITPPTALHSHHNRGSKRMRALIIQDEGLHYYTRTPGFSFE